jgi:hypothetical protein
MLVPKAIGIWLLILGCAFLNGALREMVLVPALGSPAAPLLSGVLLCACILAVSLALVPRLGTLRVSQCLHLGLLWLALTLAFEISFGLLRHQGWSTILEAYTFRNGNIWPVALLVTLIAPLMAARLRGHIQ